MKGIEFITIPVSDQQISKSFYQKLGFEVLTEAQVGENNFWIQMNLPGQEMSISLVKNFPYPEVAMQAGCVQGLVIKTDDIRSEARKLEENGIQYGIVTDAGFQQGQISDTPWGQFTHFEDPDGNGWSFHGG